MKYGIVNWFCLQVVHGQRRHGGCRGLLFGQIWKGCGLVVFAMVAELSDRYGEGGFMMEAGFEDEGFVVIMIGVGGEKSK